MPQRTETIAATFVSYTTPWPQPYPGISSGKIPKRRMTVEAGEDDCNLIASIAINPAIFSFICQQAIKDAAQYARQHNLKYTDDKQFFEYIRQRTSCGIVEEATGPDDTGRGEGVRSGVADVKTVAPESGKEVAPVSGVGGQGGRGRGRSGKGPGGGGNVGGEGKKKG